MAAIVYNGLQSCLESQVIESRVLRLKVLSSLPSSSSPSFNSQSIELALKPSFSDPNGKVEEIFSKKNISYSFLDCNMGGFSSPCSLKHDQTLLGTNEPLEEKSTNPPTAISTFVPPMAKRSSLVLSERSLQLCTENLGNETGTDMAENCIDLLETECGGKLATREQVKPALPRRRTKKAIAMHSFPPPLTTIRGSESLSVRSHREEGRLVIKAVKVSSSVSCFQAERSHGRLRLCFLKNADLIFDCEEETEQENEGIGEDYEEPVENDINRQGRKMEEGGKVEDPEDQEQEYFKGGGERYVYCDYESCENTDGNKLNVEGNTGIEKFERPRRCKEGEHESNSLLNWDALLVATS